MGIVHARTAMIVTVVIACPGAAHAGETLLGKEDPCVANPDACPSRPPPRKYVEVEWVREAPPNPMHAKRGWQLGLRMGLAHPAGAVGGGSLATTPQMSDLAKTWVPFGVDAGYRITPNLYLGATFLLGGVFGTGNVPCAACTFRDDFQALADVRWYPFPNATLNPWVAAGTGWEVMHLDFGGSSSANYDGPVLGNVQLGLDVRKGAVAAGPYLGVELAEFAFHSLDPSPAGETTAIGSTVFHEWFTVGVRASYGP